jgi:hypothetical protein
MKHKFIGEFSGKYDLTRVDGNGISNSTGSITIKIQKVGKGAYLQTIVYDKNDVVNVLGFIKDDVIVSQNQSGYGTNYTFFDGNCLIHNDTNKPPNVNNWTVKVSKLSRNRH